MEAYVKKFFWTINLVTIALCAYMGAKTVNLFVGEALYTPQQVEANAKKSKTSRTDSQSDKRQFNHKAGINPFTGEQLILPSDNPAVQEVEVKNVAATDEDLSAYSESSECVPTSIAGTLMGTMVSSNPEHSFAIIQVGDKATMFEVRQSLGQSDAHVVAVFRHKVLIRNQGRLECFIHGEQAKTSSKKTAKTTAGGEEGIRKVSETEFIISQDEINKAMDNLNLLATQARVVPSFKDGKSNGFRIYSIKPGSLYRKIGLKNGDILQRVNDTELSSPEKALELYTKLRSEKRVSINLLRRGKPVTLDYTIQ